MFLYMFYQLSDKIWYKFYENWHINIIQYIFCNPLFAWHVFVILYIINCIVITVLYFYWMGIFTLTNTAPTRYWWEQKVKCDNERKEGVMIPISSTEKLEKVFLDIRGPFPRSGGRHRYKFLSLIHILSYQN